MSIIIVHVENDVSIISGNLKIGNNRFRVSIFQGGDEIPWFDLLGYSVQLSDVYHFG